MLCEVFHQYVDSVEGSSSIRIHLDIRLFEVNLIAFLSALITRNGRLCVTHLDVITHLNESIYGMSRTAMRPVNNALLLLISVTIKGTGTDKWNYRSWYANEMQTWSEALAEN